MSWPWKKNAPSAPVSPHLCGVPFPPSPRDTAEVRWQNWRSLSKKRWTLAAGRFRFPLRLHLALALDGSRATPAAKPARTGKIGPKEAAQIAVLADKAR